MKPKSVEEAGQRVVRRHDLDFVFGLAVRSDVLVRRHPASVRERFLALRDQASVRKPAEDQHAAVALLAGLFDRLAEAAGVGWGGWRVRFGSLVGEVERKPIDLGISPVANDENAVAVVHRQTLDDVVHGVVEPGVLVGRLRLHRLALTRLGELLDAHGEENCAEQDHRRNHRRAEFESLRLEAPGGEHVVHRHCDDRGDGELFAEFTTANIRSRRSTSLT